MNVNNNLENYKNFIHYTNVETQAIQQNTNKQ